MRRRPLPITFAVLATALLGADVALGRDETITWKSIDETLEKIRKDEKAAVLLIAGDGGFQQEALAGVFADKSVQRLAKKDRVLFGKGDPMTSGAARGLLEDGVEFAVVVVDLEGAKVKSFREVPGENALQDAVKDAESVTKKKAKVLKQVEKIYDKSEKAKKKKDYKTATEGFKWIVQFEGQLLDARVKQSAEQLAELNTIADDKLRDVDGLIRDEDFARAQKALVEIRNEFPHPEVEEGVKSRQDKIARAMNRYQNP